MADSSASDLLTFAIGDIHGCVHKLDRLLERCRRYGGERALRFVFLGDFIDRGPDSRGVIEILMRLQRDGKQEVICLRGNHEAMLLDALQTDDPTLWLFNGGGAALASYGAEDPAELPAEHVRWIGTLRLSFDDGRRYFVHAGVNPTLPLDQQNEHDQVWIREPFLHSSKDYGRLIVHGHTPLASGIPEMRPNRLNLDTAAVLGGPLSAAAFTPDRTKPVAFLSDVAEPVVA
jgi:serine/threonine protein phosphatase 1